MASRPMRSTVESQAAVIPSGAASVHPGLAAAEGPDWLFLLCARFAAWQADRRRRRQLRRFSDHLLRDVGLTPRDIGISGSQHWLR
jgi:uncharacterized protein YjiS (DUF1127 family)